MFRKFLKNYRRGFATNSSSSHSFVYLKEASPDHGVDVDLRGVENEFGWEDFRLSTLKEKLFYVLVSRVSGGWVSREDVDVLVGEFPELSREEIEYGMNGYVDHESVGVVSADVARDPRVVIYGGNDNDWPVSGLRARDVKAGLVDMGESVLFDEEEGEV